MDDFLKTLIEQGNAISVVTVCIVVLTVFVWAIETEHLFSGSRGREMKQTIKEQKEALDEALEELRQVERDYDRLQFIQTLREGKEWPINSQQSTSKRRKGQ